MKIYTRTGDSGDTGLFGGQRTPKSSLRVSAYGEVDELNSMLGVVRLHTVGLSPLDEDLAELQAELFSLGADLATPVAKKEKTPRISAAHVRRLEGMIDEYTAEVPPLTRFVLPGGAPAGAYLHLARTVCRRAERQLVELIEAGGDDHAQGPEDFARPLEYLNRLSDLLFTLARWANTRGDASEVFWDPPKAEA